MNLEKEELAKKINEKLNSKENLDKNQEVESNSNEIENKENNKTSKNVKSKVTTNPKAKVASKKKTTTSSKKTTTTKKATTKKKTGSKTDKKKLLKITSKTQADGVKLNALRRKLDSLPKPIVKHSKRVMQISEFLLRRFELDDWYLDLKIKQQTLLKAIYFHDLGKCNIQKEYIYRDLCNGPSELHKYLLHIDEGLKLIPQPNIEEYAKTHPNKFFTYLYQIILYHEGNKEVDTMPIAGQIAYIANKIDNSCYRVASDVAIDLDLEAFVNIVDNLVAEFEKKNIQKEIVNYFKDNIFKSDLHDFLNTIYRRSTSRTRYGVVITSSNIHDLFDYEDAYAGVENIKPEQCKLFARKISYNLNSRYYGKVRHHEFIHVACKNRLVNRLENYYLANLVDLLETNKYDFHTLTFITISVSALNKINIKRFSKICELANIEPSNICITLDLYETSLTAQVQEAILKLKTIGFKIGVNNASTDYINIFKEIPIDYAFYDNFKTHEVDEIFVELIQSLGSVLILTNKKDNKYRYVSAGEYNITRMLKSKVGDVID